MVTGEMRGEPQGSLERKRAVVAMSGGVDSSLAASILVDAGYEVIGMMLRLWAEPSSGGLTNRCCTPQSVDDARRVASLLNIPFYLVDAEAEFKSAVVDYFVQAYGRGRTPNPCVACNRDIRFGLLLQRALALDADLATGHYARVVRKDGACHLLRGLDAAKDQSYVLYLLDQEELAHVLFPLGEMTKPQVRDLARQRGLPTAEKPESQDICFLADGDYASFVRARAEEGLRPGLMLDLSGNVVGQHSGLVNYTVGQRHGLGLAVGMPLYVVSIDAVHNAVIVGPQDALLRSSVTVSNAHYVAGEAPAGSFACQVRLRYKSREASATVSVLPGGHADIVFDEPQRPVSPGQAAVFYAGDEVLGGGVID